METPGPVTIERVYTLSRSVSAIQILPNEEGGPTRLGLITHLPVGSEIKIGGPGFSEFTVCVSCYGASYFVFLDEIEPLREHASTAHA
jgi:hypothetical protein